MRDLRRARRLAVSDSEILGDDPVFRGTRVPVHLIAELVVHGSKPAELIKSYPRLTAEMIRLAPVYAAAHPLRGPRRKQPWRDQQPVRRGPPEARHHRGVVRFLIDECLSVDLVIVAGESGHEDRHVAHVGRAGWKDWNVARYASEGDFILVTNYASDFRQLYAAQPLHVGLVILIPVVARDVQRRLFKAALDEFAVLGEPANRVLEVDLDGEKVTLTLYDLPPPAPSAPSCFSIPQFSRVAEIPHRARPCLSPRISGSAAAVRAPSDACSPAALK
jgi:uncharacterized protein (DUF433 family)/predicted nuclease of predicted toxin-antitoxin system